MKKIISTALAMVSMLMLMVTDVTAADPKVRIEMNMVKGPVKSHATYKAWATKTVSNFLESGNLNNQGDVKNLLEVEFVLQEKGKLVQENYWTVVSITGIAGFKMNLKSFRFSLDSSPNNLYDSEVYDLTKMNAVYSAEVQGFQFGAGGEGASDTKVLKNGESGDTMVDRVVMVGIQNPYIEYSKTPLQGEYTAEQLLPFVESEIKSIKTTLEVYDSQKVVVGFMTRTLQQTGSPVQPKISGLKKNETSGGEVWITYTGLDGQNTGYIQSSPVLGNLADWRTVANANASSSGIIIPTKVGQQFYRISLLP